MPIDVEPGSVVLAGSINEGGVLEIEAAAATADSTLARVVCAVEEAHEPVDGAGLDDETGRGIAKDLLRAGEEGGGAEWPVGRS